MGERTAGEPVRVESSWATTPDVVQGGVPTTSIKEKLTYFSESSVPLMWLILVLAT